MYKVICSCNYSTCGCTQTGITLKLQMDTLFSTRNWYSVAQLMCSQVVAWNCIGNKQVVVAGFEPAFICMRCCNDTHWATTPPMLAHGVFQYLSLSMIAPPPVGTRCIRWTRFIPLLSSSVDPSAGSRLVLWAHSIVSQISLPMVLKRTNMRWNSDGFMWWMSGHRKDGQTSNISCYYYTPNMQMFVDY